MPELIRSLQKECCDVHARTRAVSCPYCLLRREIVTIKFSLLKSPTALFVCSSAARRLPMTTGYPPIREDWNRRRQPVANPWKKFPSVRGAADGKEVTRSFDEVHCQSGSFITRDLGTVLSSGP